LLGRVLLGRLLVGDLLLDLDLVFHPILLVCRLEPARDQRYAVKDSSAPCRSVRTPPRQVQRGSGRTPAIQLRQTFPLECPRAVRLT
jgi:hypothetical protein